MRGSPILRALIALCILLAVGWPLHRLLRADETATVAAPKVEVKRPVHLQVSFTEVPTALRVFSLGVEVWTNNEPALEVEHDLTVAYPKEGIDLQFEIDWPEGKRTAAKVVLTDPQTVEHTAYVWGNGKTTEVLTFQ